MNVALRSRQSTYEEDLLRFLRGLNLNEIDQIQTTFTHQTRAGDPLSDYDVALNDLLQQARELTLFNRDRALARRVAAGEDVGVNQSPVRRPGVVPLPNDDGAETERNDNEEHENDATSLTLVDNSPTGHDCVVCKDPIHGAEIYVPCGHYYDISCVTDLFQSATRDESLFPPRCCKQNIPFTEVQPYLSRAFITTFRQKQAEFGTLKRVYCSSPTCSLFLGPLSEDIDCVYTCPAPGCARQTCGKCREQHSGDWTHVCLPDAHAVQVLELSRAAGWTRCPGCSHMIERRLGCNHITCRCHTQFCYLCTARWKTCQCPQGVPNENDW